MAKRRTRGRRSTTGRKGPGGSGAGAGTPGLAVVSGAAPSPLAHLSGRELATVAAASASAGFEAVFAKRNVLTKLKTDQLRNLVEMAEATRAHCGGVVCG